MSSTPSSDEEAENDVSIQQAANATIWMPGLEIDGASLVGKIATGGMAEIWLARKAGHKGFEKMVVMKKILDSYLTDPGFIEMFLDEARTAALLNHPNVVQIYDLGKHEDSYFIQMEYIAGETLSRFAKAAAKRGTFLRYEYAAKIVAEAAAGLAYAHTKLGTDGKPLNIVHRDVSPQNIMVTYEGAVKVLDFGVAKAANRATKTEVGSFKGKISYMSPEQARGLNVDARADVFALGIVLYELIGRCRLFQYTDMVEGLNAVAANTPIPSPITRNFEVPDALAEICLKALEREPARRYQSARELQHALESWLATPPGAPTSEELSRYMKDLFAERIATQERMLAAIREGDSSAFKPRHSFAELPVAPAAPVRRRKKLGPLPLALAAASAVVVLGIGIALGTRKPPNAPVVAPPPVAVAPASLAVESDPPGAAITLDGTDVGSAPLVVPQVATGEHVLLAMLDGHQPATRTIKIERAGERTNVLVNLEPTPVEPTTPPVVGGPKPAASPPPGAAPPRAKGKLTLSTTPWAEVYEGTRKLGDSPLVDLPLSAGKHQLRLVNPEKGVDKSISVDIKPGQTTALRQKL